MPLRGYRHSAANPKRASLPPEVRELAARLGASAEVSGSRVMLRQQGTMRDQPGSRWMRFRAVETISLTAPEFVWRASCGPFGCVAVVDSLSNAGAELEVRACRYWRIASLGGGAALTKGEVMRYLAELAWAPDAILWDPYLVWAVAGGGVLRVSTGHGTARGEVRLRLDEDGRIAVVEAADRPRREGADFVERPWHGRFFDYRRCQGRWLPFAAEVGWVLEGEPFIVWRGKLRDWRIE